MAIVGSLFSKIIKLLHLAINLKFTICWRISYHQATDLSFVFLYLQNAKLSIAIMKETEETDFANAFSRRENATQTSCLRFWKSISPARVTWTGIIRNPARAADAGFVPWADTGIRQIYRRNCILISENKKLVFIL